MIVILIYVVILIAAILFSFLLRKGYARMALRVTAIAMMSVPIVIGILVVFFFWETAPPTLAHLEKIFPVERHDLETLLAMSNSDSRFYRIDPEFLDQVGTDGAFQGRYMAGDPKSQLPAARWNEYRKLFKHNHLDQGIERNAAGDAFFRFGAQGLLDRGYATGIVFCQSAPSTASPETRYEPCSSDKSDGSGRENEAPRHEGFEFHRVAPNWFAYEQGPG